MLQHTPTQSRLIAEHKARRARFEAAALPRVLADRMAADRRQAAMKAEIQRQFDEAWRMIAAAEREKTPHPVDSEDFGFVRIRFHTIVGEVARFYGVTSLDIRSKRRTAIVVRPRQIAAYLGRTMTHNSLPEIGRRLGGRDHTTILHAVNKINAERQTNPALAAELEAIARKIEAQS